MQFKYLFICTTPLQILIAQNIILTKKLNKSDTLFIILYPKQNSIYINYIQDISFKFKVLQFPISTTSKINFFFSLIKLRLFIKQQLQQYNFIHIYAASIFDICIQLVLSHTKFKDFKTFDDGTANLFIDSKFYQTQEKSNWYYSYTRFFLKIQFTTIKLRNLSKEHFTIFNEKIILREAPYIKHYIDITPKSLNLTQFHRTSNKTINIFLGAPWEVLDYNLNYIENLYIHITDALYFKHPRETIHSSVFNYINSNLILEDFIVNLLNENPSCKVNLYGLLSTSLLTVANFPQVSCICIYDDNMKAQFKMLLDTFAKGNVRLTPVADITNE